MCACRQLSLYLFTCPFFIVQRQDPLFRARTLHDASKKGKKGRKIEKKNILFEGAVLNSCEISDAIMAISSK